MLDNKNKKIAEREEEMLELFILLEENNFASAKEASIRYARLAGITNLSIAHTELRAKYKLYIGGFVMYSYMETTALDICPNCGQNTMDKEGDCHNADCLDDQREYEEYLLSLGEQESISIFDGTPDWMRML